MRTLPSASKHTYVHFQPLILTHRSQIEPYVATTVRLKPLLESQHTQELPLNHPTPLSAF